MQIPSRNQLLEALQRGSHADLAVLDQYLQHSECKISLLVRATFREGCLKAVTHILKQAKVKQHIQMLPVGDILLSILETAVDCGKHRHICELVAAIPVLPDTIRRSDSIMKLLSQKPKLLWQRHLAAALNAKLPSVVTNIIFDFAFDKRAIISQVEIRDLVESVSDTRRSLLFRI